jgi:hypothetical protein
MRLQEIPHGLCESLASLLGRLPQRRERARRICVELSAQDMFTRLARRTVTTRQEHHSGPASPRGAIGKKQRSGSPHGC